MLGPFHRETVRLLERFRAVMAYAGAGLGAPEVMKNRGGSWSIQPSHCPIMGLPINRSRELAISGVPTFLMAGRVLVGAHPYETLEELVKQAG